MPGRRSDHRDLTPPKRPVALGVCPPGTGKKGPDCWPGIKGYEVESGATYRVC